MKVKIPFPKQVLSPIKNYLSSMQHILERRKKGLDKEDPFKDPARVDDNAAIDADAAEISGHDRVEALRFEIDRRLIMVRKALTKIKVGRYGLCENCGKMIDTDRLAANPTSELCINCEKVKQEK